MIGVRIQRNDAGNHSNLLNKLAYDPDYRVLLFGIISVAMGIYMQTIEIIVLGLGLFVLGILFIMQQRRIQKKLLIIGILTVVYGLLMRFVWVIIFGLYLSFWGMLAVKYGSKEKKTKPKQS